MTSRDLFPFGKYKDQPISVVPQSYRDWICDQDWFPAKYPELHEFLTSDEGVADAPPTEERKVINLEETIFKAAPIAFILWWKNAYGERLRKQGEHLYIPYLRVALEAWNEAMHQKDESKHLPQAPEDSDAIDCVNDDMPEPNY